MVQQLTKKLETLWQKFKMKKQEIDEVVQENQREKLELHDTVRDLTKELRLKVAARFRCSTQVSWVLCVPGIDSNPPAHAAGRVTFGIFENRVNV